MKQWNIWKWNAARQGATGGWKYIETIETATATGAVEIARNRYGAGKFEAYPHIDNPTPARFAVRQKWNK